MQVSVLHSLYCCCVFVVDRQHTLSGAHCQSAPGPVLLLLLLLLLRLPLLLLHCLAFVLDRRREAPPFRPGLHDCQASRAHKRARGPLHPAHG